MALAVSPELAEALCGDIRAFLDASAAEVPGSVSSRNGRSIVNHTTGRLQGYFANLQSALPKSSIAALAAQWVQVLPADREASDAEVASIEDQARAILTPAVEGLSDELITDLSENGAVAYTESARQVRDAALEEFDLEAPEDQAFSGVISFLEVIPGIRDLPVPQEIQTFARAWSTGRVVGLNETSLTELSGTIARALRKKNRGVADVARAIKAKFGDFDSNRAALIANTEMNSMMSIAARERGMSLGATGKVWVTVGDDRVSQEICQPNESEGRIAIRQFFGSGHENPPGHPRCRCAIVTLGSTRSSVAQGASPAGTRSFLRAVGTTVRVGETIVPILRPIPASGVTGARAVTGVTTP